MIRRIAICAMFCVLAMGAAVMRAQSIPDAPAPAPVDPHGKIGSKTGIPSQSKDASANPDATNPQPPAPSAADDNAFPEAVSKAAAGNTEATAPQTGKQDSGGRRSSGNDNPFPEDQSKAAAKDADPDADSPSSSSKEADDKSGAADLPKQGETAAAADPKRAAKDLQVGKFYLDSGDYKGAYARFKEAAGLSPDNPEIVFQLAESARKLNHLDEAVTNYKLCLELDPDGPRAKAAKRALASFDKLASR